MLPNDRALDPLYDAAVSSRTLPPGPKGGLLLGVYREFIGDQLSALTRYQRGYGDVVPFRIGPARVVMLNHPDLVEQVLVTRAQSFNKGAVEQLVRPAAGNGILLSEG